MWLDRTQIWVQNYLNENGSNVADLYAALRRRMRTTAAGSHSTSPDQELHIYVGSVPTYFIQNYYFCTTFKYRVSQKKCCLVEKRP